MHDFVDPVPALKQQLVRAILERLAKSHPLYIARRLGIDWPRVSNLERRRLERFSLQRLVRLAARVDGGEVSIGVRWTKPPLWIESRRLG